MAGSAQEDFKSVRIYRPLQAYILTYLIQKYNDENRIKDDVPVIPNNLDKVKIFHLFDNGSGKFKQKTLGAFFIEKITDKLEKQNRTIARVNQQCIYINIWKAYRAKKPSELKVDDPYLEYYLLFLDIPFSYIDIENAFEFRVKSQLKDHLNNDISFGEYDNQLKEFKKVEVFQNSNFFFKCYLADNKEITKGKLILERLNSKDDFFSASLTLQIKSEEGLAYQQYVGTLSEKEEICYADFTELKKAHWILYAPNRSFFYNEVTLGVFCAVDKQGTAPVAGQLLLEKVDAADEIADFFEKEVPEIVFHHLSGKRLTIPQKNIRKLTDLIPDESTMDGVYKCYFLSISGHNLRECIYEISPEKIVRGKVSLRVIDKEDNVHIEDYNYRGKLTTKNGWTCIHIWGNRGDEYEVFLKNSDKNHPQIFYGLYFGWDYEGRPRAGREVFIPYTGSAPFEALKATEHARESAHYQQLCEKYQIDHFFEEYKDSPIPKIINWLPQFAETPASGSIPKFLVGNYELFHLTPEEREDAGHFGKAISKDILTIQSNGAVKIEILHGASLTGSAQLFGNYLYVQVKTETRIRYAIFFINSIEKYADTISGINLYTNSNNDIVGARELLVKIKGASSAPAILPLSNEVIQKINQIQENAFLHLVGFTDNYLRQKRALNANTIISRRFDYGELYFYAACYASLVNDADSKIIRLLEEAFRHGFKDIPILRQALNNYQILGQRRSHIEIPDFLKKELFKVKTSDIVPLFKSTAQVFQVPYHGKYNEPFIDYLFELYRKTAHELHIVGEVAQNVSKQNESLIEKLYDTIEFVLDKDAAIEVYRYQTVKPVAPVWLKKLLQLKAKYGDRFHLYASNDNFQLSNFNLILIDPLYDFNTSIILITRDNDDRNDVSVPVLSIIDKGNKELADALLSKKRKIQRLFQELQNVSEIKKALT
ncbi:MAG TPA: hypothetical protein PKA00_15490 [Saprospiraceae bacterium]|nr:hypothetical protein [Saprospiraceae bacterium]HMQ84316.1 hypothetical protein [Saprospiraceae bacterium]